ncbi:class I SAM-dependent methyltransferase [Cryptosporangium phraense]|uniref:Class I SAM-dependent methyltransferase n=1 Tax=Cryptosporangium phraense TaxID=2593070 RepID=A0A545AZL1_9ACTN|nr:class I SAM-dependent methyltransferase [Cryptosporangium phraense]TQS46752.1 class I SAM-dependent methyltransferase [Cryptosporangium phraense]
MATNEAPGTAGADYAERLQRLETARWKQVLNVQAPYRWNLRRLQLGRTLDVGCGIGRNLSHLQDGKNPPPVGVDHNPTSIELARARGFTAYTVDDFFASDDFQPGSFDAILASHLVEHLLEPDAKAVVESYLPYLRSGGRVVFITPQEKGYTTDATHIRFSGFDEVSALARDVGLTVVKKYSFPFPRFAGKFFAYNEFVVVARKP